MCATKDRLICPGLIRPQISPVGGGLTPHHHHHTIQRIRISTSTYRYVNKDPTGKRCPDVFGVHVSNNGRVLAGAISHQVIHVALPGHVCAKFKFKDGKCVGRNKSQVCSRASLDCQLDTKAFFSKIPARHVPAFFWVWGSRREATPVGQRLGVACLEIPPPKPLFGSSLPIPNAFFWRM